MKKYKIPKNSKVKISKASEDILGRMLEKDP